MRRCTFIVVLLLLLVARPAAATVYSWHDSGGALHISNDSDEVPAGQADDLRKFTARKFTAKDPARSSADPSIAGLPSPAPVDDPPGDYQRGLEAGMRVAESQVRMAAELARTILAAMPAREPVPVAQPPAVSVSYVPGPDDFVGSGYGCDGYLGCGYPYPYWYFGPAIVGRRLDRHFHHPGMRGSGNGLFLAHDFAARNNGIFPRGFGR